MKHRSLWSLSSAIALACVTVACTPSSNPTDSPTVPAVPSPPRVVNVTVGGVGPTLFGQRGQSVQLRAMAELSNGFIEDRTASAQWQSSNGAVASVSTAGVLTIGDEGAATVSATVGGQRGDFGVQVRHASRTPDPPPGQILPLPTNVFALVQQFNAERPDLLRAQSCPQGLKYVNNPWLDHIVDRLRTVDTRWGYNAKPTRTAVDNGGVPVVAAGDEIAYNYGSGPDEGATTVYLIDILGDHCGGNPGLTYRHFTGEEPGRWTGAGRF